MAGVRVELKYFTETGKYYCEGEYTSNKSHLWEIWDEVRQMQDNRKLPGLVKGCTQFTILVEAPGHEYDHPRLILGKFEEA